MYYPIKVTGFKPTDADTLITIKAQANVMPEMIKYNEGKGISGELRIDDPRRISADQRKKIYATLKDIADWMGDIPEYVKELFKFNYCGESGEEYFSLSDCTVTIAKEFINYILEFAIMNGVPLQDLAINRTDDIDKYLYYCIKHKVCSICGKRGEIHHEKSIGMGNNRRKLDDSQHEKICLCRVHQSEAHTIGNTEFMSRYKVYGIIYKG